MRALRNSHDIGIVTVLGAPRTLQHLHEVGVRHIGGDAFRDVQNLLVQGWLCFDVETV